ncbi:MAG: gliding motility-associated C-terminal domain-containing protein [Bacteroidetes bacterium]|nr:gliding motility-associated C-terminal domain-containing protein [Bacteroidota bacterium]
MLLSKNYFKAQILLVLLCFNTIYLFSQNKPSPFSTNLNPQGERNFLEDRSQWKELEQERKIFSSSFLTPDGRTIIYYSKAPVNYYNGKGILVPINPVPTFSSKGLTAPDQPNNVSVLNNGTIEINTGDGSTISYSGNSKINGNTTYISEIKLDGENAIMQNIIPGVDKTFEFRFNSLKYNYVINHPLSTSSSDLIIEEEIGMPQNAKVIPDPNYGQQDARGWLGALTINSENGKELGTIRGALCYDANKNYITAAYKLETENGKQKIKIIVPASWMNDPVRIYPITIDPLVTGPTSTWTGGFIPSCIAPASGADSILVTIPAKVTVTALFVSGSFYANPFTTAIMNDGAMFFSTSCNTSTSFTTTGTAGITAGTAYLTAYDLKSPLLCCKPQSCTAQTFYLSMHVQRTAPGTGCNTTYIYHDPFGGYPFSAYVEGHTVEGYGPLWNVTPSTICSNVCNINGVVYIKYGVPPFTITHPWMTGSVIVGAPAGCSTASVIKTLNLTIPTCPWTCDTISVLSVPPATVTDACGNILTGAVSKIIHIKETPEVTASPNPLTNCSGDPFTITLTPCLGTSVVSWNGNGTSGTGTSISQTVVNTNSTVTSTTYQVSAVNNTCNSDTITVTVNTDPLPVANFTVAPQPVIINNPLGFTDNTSAVGGSANSWFWNFGDGTFDTNQNPSHIYTIPGTYHVCLDIQTSDGCLDTICHDINVIPAELVLPNVITPNGDNLNDFLYFKYLEFFGTNNLKVYDRWGKIVYQKENYTNDWSAANVTDGTYYYVLAVESGKSFPGYVQIIHK